MSENRVVALRRKGAIDDPLTENLRAGARRLIAQAVEAEFETFSPRTPNLFLLTVVSAWFATGMIRFARSRRESDRSKCKSRRRVIVVRRRRADTLHVEYSAQMGPPDEEPRRSAAGSLPARDFRRRFPGGPHGLARQGRAAIFRRQ